MLKILLIGAGAVVVMFLLLLTCCLCVISGRLSRWEERADRLRRIREVIANHEE